MTFDRAVPLQLKELQQWFASIITRPIDVDNNMNPVSPSGKPMVEEACDYITPSPTLRPAQRIQLYNQQYWWRLLSTMHDVYPLVTRLFGYTDFNQSLVVPFLVKYPPDHWSLSYLGDRFPFWIENEYHENDRELVLNSAKIDWAYNDCFLAAQKPTLDALKLQGDELLTLPLVLQPYVHLFELPYDLFQFRIDFIKQDPEYWVEHDFPELVSLPEGEMFHFVMYRNFSNQTIVETIGASEYQVLKLFDEGSTVDEVCQWLEKQEGPLVEEASQNLNLWFQRWTALRLLACREDGSL